MWGCWQLRLKEQPEEATLCLGFTLHYFQNPEAWNILLEVEFGFKKAILYLFFVKCVAKNKCTVR